MTRENLQVLNKRKTNLNLYTWNFCANFSFGCRIDVIWLIYIRIVSTSWVPVGSTWTSGRENENALIHSRRRSKWITVQLPWLTCLSQDSVFRWLTWNFYNSHTPGGSKNVQWTKCSLSTNDIDFLTKISGFAGKKSSTFLEHFTEIFSLLQKLQVLQYFILYSKLRQNGQSIVMFNIRGC